MKSKLVYRAGDMVYNHTQPGYYKVMGVLPTGHYTATRIAERDCSLVVDGLEYVLNPATTTEGSVHAMSELRKQGQRVDKLLMVSDGYDESYMPVTVEEMVKRDEVQQPQ